MCCSLWVCACRQFAEACGHALDVNERLIKEDQFEYQGEMKSHYKDMLSELSAVMNEQVRSSILMLVGLHEDGYLGLPVTSAAVQQNARSKTTQCNSYWENAVYSFLFFPSLYLNPTVLCLMNLLDQKIFAFYQPKS